MLCPALGTKLKTLPLAVMTQFQLRAIVPPYSCFLLLLSTHSPQQTHRFGCGIRSGPRSSVWGLGVPALLGGAEKKWECVKEPATFQASYQGPLVNFQVVSQQRDCFFFLSILDLHTMSC